MVPKDTTYTCEDANDGIILFIFHFKMIYRKKTWVPKFAYENNYTDKGRLFGYVGKRKFQNKDTKMSFFVTICQVWDILIWKGKK